MAVKQFDPTLLDEALAFYENIIKGNDPENPHGFPLDQNQLVASISLTAYRARRLDLISGRLEKLTQQAIRSLEAKPSIPSEVRIGQLRDTMTQIQRQYEPVPKDADAETAVKTAAKLMFESMTLAGMMKARSLTYGQAFSSPEFKSYQKNLEKEIEADNAALKKDVFFQRYVKDYPVTGDTISISLTGGAGALLVPVREVLTHALIAADDPTVRQHAFNYATFNGDDAQKELHLMMRAAWERIEKATFSKEVQQKRFPIDMIAGAALTSPVFLKAVGLPTYLPKNLLLKSLQEVKEYGISLKNAAKGTYARTFIDFFRDRQAMAAEKFEERIMEKLPQLLGKESGPQIVAGIRERVRDTIKSIASDMGERMDIARRIYESTEEQIRAFFADMTPGEKLAVLYKRQGRKDLAPEDAIVAWATPKVEATSKKVNEILDNLIKADPTIPNRTDYWPAFQAKIESTWDAVKKAALEPYKKLRIETDVVTATAETIDERIDDLIFRTAAPLLNAIQKKAASHANTVAAIVSDATQEFLSKPEQMKLIGQTLVETAAPKLSQTRQAISAIMNAGYLTTRPVAWAFSDALDRTFNTVGNILIRAKNGKAISTRELFRNGPVPPDIIEDIVSHPAASESALAWRPMAWLHKYNDLMYRGNKMLDNFSNATMYRLNYGSELADIARKTGVPVDQLGEPAKNLAAQAAVEATKKFGLAYSFSSALTTHPATAVAFPYLGFYLKSANRTIQTLGEAPELYKVAAFGLQKVREINREYPGEWQKQSHDVFGIGHKTSIFQKMPVYPVVKVLTDSYFGPVPGREAPLKEKANIIRNTQDATLRWQMIDSDPDVTDYLVQEPGRSMASFFESLREMQAIPLGPAATIPLETTKMLEERTPHWFPGGRAANNLFRGLGLDMGPEDKIDKLFLQRGVEAYNDNTFQADVATEMLLMKMKGEDKPFTDQQFAEVAEKKVRSRYLQNFVVGHVLGLGQKDLPEVQQFWNKLSEIRDAKHLFLPTEKESKEIKDATGIEDQRWIDEIWRGSYLRTYGYEKQLKDYQMDILKNFPAIPDTDPVTAFRSIQAAKKQANIRDQVVTEIRDRLTMYNRIPKSNIGDILPMDIKFKALLLSYDSEPVIDKNGQEVGVRINWTGEGENPLGPRILKLMQMKPDELLDHYKKGTDDNAIIETLWPKKFDELRMEAPEIESRVFSNIDRDKLPLDNKDMSFISVASESIEEKFRSEKLRDFFSTVKQLAPENPLEFPNAASKFIIRNKGAIKEIFDKVRPVFKKIDELITSANPFQLDQAYASTPEEMATADEILREPKTTADFKRIQKAQAAVQEMSPLIRTGKIADQNKAIAMYRNLLQEDQMAGLLVQRMRPHWMDFYYAADKMTNGGAINEDLRRLAVGDSLREDYWSWVSDVKDAMRNPAATQKDIEKLVQVGKLANDQGFSFFDALRQKNGANVVAELEWRKKGNRYALGNYGMPNFPEGAVAARQAYFDLAFQRPDETRQEWEERLTKTVQSEEQMPLTLFKQVIEHFKDRDPEVVDALTKVRNKQYTAIPLDRFNKLKINSARDYIIANLDDVPSVYRYLQQDPDLTEMLRKYDQRTYRTVEKKIFHDADQVAMNYMRAAGFDPEAMKHVRRHNPNTFNRLFFNEPEFQALALSKGLGPTTPDPSTAVTRTITDPRTGEQRQIQVASVLATPEPLMPEPVPEGVFSNLPNMLNFIQRRSRIETKRLLAQDPKLLSQSEKEYLAAPPSAQVFRLIPSVIGQAFREGKLAPQDVVKQFENVADYGLATGALDQTSYQKFATFLNQSSTVIGATQFGFRLGQFLDDTFNTPRIPVNPAVGKFTDFFLAGGPVSQRAPLLPGERPRLVTPIAPTVQSPVTPTFENLPPAPQPLPGGPTKGQRVTETGAQLTGAAAPAASKLPPLAVTLAVVSAGFTVANIIQSKKAREKLKREAQRAREDQERRLLEAKREAEAKFEEDFQRQGAQERFRAAQRVQEEAEEDFARRSLQFLREGASFASFAQQPREFQARFVDRFEPEVLRFTQRPQFESRVGLIQSIIGRLPRARY